MENNYPIINKWYRVTKGPFKNFKGKCVSIDFNSPLPIILVDEIDDYDSAAVKYDEISEIGAIWDAVDIQNNQKN